ncbi:MAG: hypothetical protein J6S60_07270 [Oscillospiraceae bacterium]|nr:hypothetical protein [Oscillospiraceae bacterium]
MSVMGKPLLIRGAHGSASGAAASFPDGDGSALRGLTAQIEMVRGGSGTPTPTNIRPLSGWNGCNIVVSPTSLAADGTTYPFSWQTEAGTVYGGTLDALTGLLTIDYDYAETNADGNLQYYHLGVLRYTTTPTASSTSYFYYEIPLSINQEASTLGRYRSRCSHYSESESQVAQSENRFTIRISDNYHRFTMNPSNIPGYQEAEDADARKAAVKAYFAGQYTLGTPLQAAIRLATPATIQLTPQQVMSLAGQNNIWADCGPVDVQYNKQGLLYMS